MAEAQARAINDAKSYKQRSKVLLHWNKLCFVLKQPLGIWKQEKKFYFSYIWLLEYSNCRFIIERCPYVFTRYIEG